MDLCLPLSVSIDYVYSNMNARTFQLQCYHYNYPHETAPLRFYFPLDFSAVLHELSTIDFTLREMYLAFNYLFYRPPQTLMSSSRTSCMPLLSLSKAQSSMGLQMLRSVSCISYVQERDLDLSAELLAEIQALSACYWKRSTGGKIKKAIG